ALGRAATGRDPAGRELALARIHRLGRNSARYLPTIQANEPHERDRAGFDASELLSYARDASSLERQRAQFELDGVHPRWALRARWRQQIPNGRWFGGRELDA